MIVFSSRYLLVFVLCVQALASSAQEINNYSIGTWRDHFPYGNVVDLCIGGDKRVYCAATNSVFAFDAGSNEMERINKTNALSDVGIASIELDPATKTIVVGYKNGNLDFLNGRKAVNMPDIKLSGQEGDKTIYDIRPYNGWLYLSTGFGVVVVDPSRLEVRSTFYLGTGGVAARINDIAFNNDSIYVAVGNGIKKASANDPFLADVTRWRDVQGLPGTGTVKDIEFFQNYMIISQAAEDRDVVWRRPLSSTVWEEFASFADLRFNRLWTDGKWLCLAGQGAYQVYHFDFGQNINTVVHNGNIANANMMIVHPDFGFMAGDQQNGMMWTKFSGEQLNIKPGGPSMINVRKLNAYNDNLWVAPGGATGFWGNFYNTFNIPAFVDDEWAMVPNDREAQSENLVIDFMSAAIDPKDQKHVYLGSWQDGLVEVYDKRVVNIFNSTNSTLQTSGFDWSPIWTGVGGTSFDLDGIFWCSNTYTSRCIQARDRSGTFYSFNFAPTITAANVITEIVATREGYVWALVPTRGILAFNYNKTLGNTGDDSFKLLTDVEGFGGLPNKDVQCMEEDLDGEMWVGTQQGLTVFYNQAAIFTEQNYDAEQILITQDGNVQKLLETESITAIKIDGSNRKWIGTQNSGVYLFSDDGLRQVYHFTVENSPLPSNNIYDIAINQRNGEVFIATEQGMVAFFSTATNFDLEMKSIRAFPNPVLPDYDGNITIDGLAYDTVVKITDLQGNLVFETTSEGGRAVWDGKTINGDKPASGVYLVLAATKDGKTDNTTKLTIVK